MAVAAIFQYSRHQHAFWPFSTTKLHFIIQQWYTIIVQHKKYFLLVPYFYVCDENSLLQTKSGEKWHPKICVFGLVEEHAGSRGNFNIEKLSYRLSFKS